MAKAALMRNGQYLATMATIRVRSAAIRSAQSSIFVLDVHSAVGNIVLFVLFISVGFLFPNPAQSLEFLF